MLFLQRDQSKDDIFSVKNQKQRRKFVLVTDQSKDNKCVLVTDQSKVDILFL